MKRTATKRRDTGTTIRWKPDLEVFTDIAVPADYYRDIPVSYTHLTGRFSRC